MNEYIVEWVIEITADTPEQAAIAALRIQRDPTSMATVFDVRDDSGIAHRVDLVDERCATWDEHPVFLVSDWQYEVRNDDTRLGYWEWVNKKLQEQNE